MCSEIIVSTAGSRSGWAKFNDLKRGLKSGLIWMKMIEDCVSGGTRHISGRVHEFLIVFLTELSAESAWFGKKIPTVGLISK